MCTEFTNRVTSSSTQSCSRSTKHTSRNSKFGPQENVETLANMAVRTKSSDNKPVFLVFHGGSGSSKQEYLDAISYGVVKVNLDTDLQWAYLTGIRDYVLNKKDYVMSQVGNPDGADKPNKKYYDPRVWVREGEKTMSTRIAEALKDFNTAGQI